MKNLVFVVALFLGVVACVDLESANDSHEETTETVQPVSIKQALTLSSFVVTETFPGDQTAQIIMWGTDPAWVFGDNSGRHSTIRYRLNFIPNGCRLDKVTVSYQRNGSYSAMHFTVYDLGNPAAPLGALSSSAYPIWPAITEDVIVNKVIPDTHDTYLYVVGTASLHMLFAASVYYSC